MSADGSVELFFGDGTHRFRLAIGQFRELQEKVNGRRILVGAPPIGPATLLEALQTNNAWPDDMRDVLRLGLVGGGMKPQEAHRLLLNNFDDKPPQSIGPTVFLILLAALVGVPEDEIVSKKNESEATTTSSDSVTSMGSGLQ
jgi:hypothetical protein